jgi:hypothetical protein
LRKIRLVLQRSFNSWLIFYIWFEKCELFVVQCGLSGNTTGLSDRIVGGTNAAENEFPWQVSACRSQGCP